MTKHHSFDDVIPHVEALCALIGVDFESVSHLSLNCYGDLTITQPKTLYPRSEESITRTYPSSEPGPRTIR